MTDSLRELLEAQKAKTEALQKERGIVCPWVFHRHGKRIDNFRKAWVTACRKAGVPGSRTISGGLRCETWCAPGSRSA